MKIRIEVKYKGERKFFYYPDESCRTRDGGMKMLLDELKHINEPHEIKVTLNEA